jgi:hypothetical protein
MPTLRCSTPAILILLLIANPAFAQDEPTERAMPSPPQTRGATAPSISIVFTNIKSRCLGDSRREIRRIQGPG